jgi:hypothetical protein
MAQKSLKNYESLPCFITVEYITSFYFCVKGSETSELVGHNADVLLVWIGKNLEGITIEHGWKYEEKTERTLLARSDSRISSKDIIETVMHTN